MQISVRRGLAWMALSQGGSFLVNFGGSVVMARLLSPREMGVYAVAVAIVGILAVLRSLGLNTFIIRETQLTSSVLSTTFTINAGLAALSSVLLLICSTFAGWAMGDPGVSSILQVLALSPIVSAFEFLPSAYLERNGAFRSLSMVNLLRGALGVCTTITLAWLGYSYMSIAWGNLASMVFGAVALCIAGRPFIHLRIGVSDWRRVMKFGMQMLTVSVIGSIQERLFDILLGRVVGLGALGLYSRASGLNSLLWDNLHLVIARIVFVDFAERRRRGMSLRDGYLQIIAILTAFLWPAFAGLAILAGPVIYIVYGPKWTAAATPLSLLSTAGIFYVAVTMTWELYIVQGAMGAQLRFQLKRTTAATCLFSAGCLGGLNWAAASRVADSLVTVLLARRDIQRLTDTDSSDYWPIYIQSAGLTVLACGPAAVLMMTNSWSEQTGITSILCAVILGMCSWLVGLYLTKHPLHTEITRAWGKAKSKLLTYII